MSDNTDASDFIVVTISLYKVRSAELYALACNLLPNVNGVDWRIVLTDIDLDYSELNITNINYYNRIVHLAEQTKNRVSFYPLKNVSVAHAKADIFKLVSTYNKWIINVDDDIIFNMERLKNIISYVSIYGDKSELYLYPVVDLFNGREHSDFIGAIVSCREANHIAQEYGDGILGHLKIEDRGIVSTATKIGSAGFIVHSSSITNEKLSYLYSFPEGERGHDIIFCDTYENKRVLVNAWTFHMRVDESMYNNYWKEYNLLAHKIYNQI